MSDGETVPPPPPRKECAIAIAAYCSELEPTVNYLREFRDNVILKSKYQKMFEALLRLYYFFSPPVAEKMIQNERFKQVMKGFIVKPIVTTLALVFL